MLVLWKMKMEKFSLKGMNVKRGIGLMSGARGRGKGRRRSP